MVCLGSNPSAGRQMSWFIYIRVKLTNGKKDKKILQISKAQFVEQMHVAAFLGTNPSDARQMSWFISLNINR